MHIELRIKETGHPDVKPWWAYVYVEGRHVGTGDVKGCKALFDELVEDPIKAKAVFDAFEKGERK